MTVEEFIEKYNPHMSEDTGIKQYDTIGEDYDEIKHIDSKYIWTAQNGPGNSIIYVNGRFWANRFYYIVCKKPWKAEYPGTLEVIDK